MILIRSDNLHLILDRSEASLNSQRAKYDHSKISVDQEKINVATAREDLERNKRLYEDSIISKQELDKSRRDYDLASNNLEGAIENKNSLHYAVKSSLASLQEAQRNVGLSTIYSPIDGYIVNIDVNEGEKVLGTVSVQGTKLIKIVNTDSMIMKCYVVEKDILKIDLRDSSEIYFPSINNTEDLIYGVVNYIGQVPSNYNTLVGESAMEFEVRISILLDNAMLLQHKFIRSGMTGRVNIIINKRLNALSVPISAITFREQSNLSAKKDEREDREVIFEYVPSKKIVKARYIRSGISNLDYIEIVEGIGDDALIVIGPFYTLNRLLLDNSKVYVIK